MALQDFAEGGYLIKEGDERVVFQALDNLVFIGTNKGSFVVEVPDPPNVPKVSAFYLPKPDEPRIVSISTLTELPNDDFGFQSIRLRLQYVKLTGDQDDLEDHQGAYPGQRKADVFELLTEKVVVSEPSESIRIDNIVTDISSEGNAINDLEPDVAEQVRTTVDIELTSNLPEGVYVDVYRALRNQDISDESGEYWYWMARFPVEDTRLRYTFELTDYNVKSYPELIHVGSGQPNFLYADTNEFRLYAASERSNRVWLSYYDAATAEKLFQNFTDFIDLDLGEGFITGLRFIRDNLLVVYATNQIQLISTDPLAELHQVVDFIAPQDDRGVRIGCIAPESVVDMGGEHFFLASNRYVYRFNSRTARTISDPVQAIFDAIVLPVTNMGEPEISRVVAFTYEKDYFISIPSSLEESVSGYPNTTLMYDTEYRRWWQDRYAVRSISKGYPERLFTVIDGRLFLLFVGDTDDGAGIRRTWRSNPELRRTHDKFRSVHVYAMGPAVIDVIAKTEQGEESGQSGVEQTSDVWSQRLGVNLRGRNFTVEIATESDAPIDRIMTNELFRS